MILFNQFVTIQLFKQGIEASISSVSDRFDTIVSNPWAEYQNHNQVPIISVNLLLTITDYHDAFMYQNEEAPRPTRQ